MNPSCWNCERIHGCKKVPLTREAFTYTCLDYFPAAPEDVQARNCILHEFGIGSIKTLRDTRGKKMTATSTPNLIKSAVENGDINELQKLFTSATVPHLMIPACNLKGPQFVTAQVQGKTPEEKLRILSTLLLEIAQERSASKAPVSEDPPFTPDAPNADKPKQGRGRPRKEASADEAAVTTEPPVVLVVPDTNVLLQNISENVARIGNHLTHIETRIAALEAQLGATQSDVAALRQDILAQAQALGLVG